MPTSDPAEAHGEDATLSMSEMAECLNDMLHKAMNDETCAIACVHQVFPGWTALGIANVAARRIAALAIGSTASGLSHHGGDAAESP